VVLNLILAPVLYRANIQREICASASVSQKTVVKVQKQASELGMNWPLDDI
jgi:hypothetical protein